MTEELWDACARPHEMLDALRAGGVADERKLRLFAAACCRRGWELFQDERVRSAVELAERYADDPALASEFARLDDPASVRRGGVNVPYLGWRDPFKAAAGVSVWIANLVSGRSKPQGYTDPGWVAERAGHARLLRDVFGDPSRPAAVKREWVAANDRAAFEVARSIYDERAFERMPILADALEDAGCDDGAILAHCRGPGPHVRGCWVVDAVLGKG